jgi:hypothetical protein
MNVMLVVLIWFRFYVFVFVPVVLFFVNVSVDEVVFIDYLLWLGVWCIIVIVTCIGFVGGRVLVRVSSGMGW